MRASVVIPCYNGAEVIGAQLRALIPQLASDMEIIIADNRSTDDLAAVVAATTAGSQATVRIVRASDRQGINHARNTGVRASKGSMVLLCDADDVVSASWVSRMIAGLTIARSVGGPLHAVLADGASLGDSPATRLVPWSGALVATATGANCGFRRELFDELDGFDENFIGGYDEVDFFARASLADAAPVGVPDAQIDYLQRSRLPDVFRQNVAYGRGSVHMHIKHAPAGMLRDPWWKPPVAVAVGVAQLCAFSPASRRRGLARLGVRYGRLTESIYRRHLYL